MLIRLLCIFFFLASYANAGVLFEDDFNGFTTGWTPSTNSAGHHVTGGTAENPGKGEPTGWTGWIKHDTSAYIGIVTGEGRDSSPCLKIGPESQSPFDQVGLVKYLGSTGYEELYIRYYQKFDDSWKWGDGTTGSFAYYKQLRIWQNLTDDEILGNTGFISSEDDRNFLLVEIGEDGGEFSPDFMIRASRNLVGELSDSASDLSCVGRGGTYQSGDYGFIENYCGNIDGSGDFDDSQTWHCIEYHVVLSEDGVANGTFEMWIDGTKQNWPGIWLNGFTGIITEKLGVGMNYITLHDNGTGAQNWPAMRYVWIDDVVVSTEYIGTDYVIGEEDLPETTVSGATFSGVTFGGD